MTDLVLGIDPGKSSGWALVTAESRPELCEHGRVRLDKGETPTFALEKIHDTMAGDLVAVVIESQFVALNIKTAIRLAQYAGRWEEAVAAVFPDLTVEWVKPNEWQSSMLKGFAAGNAKRDERKAASVTVCRVRWKKELDVDVADSALIAAWQAEKIAFDKRLTTPLSKAYR
jgi:Holliday junction resolvasome RuvABC endonuclease subunit